jgi:alpha-ketoglutarate-dependent sulfate ester dioxygenase
MTISPPKTTAKQLTVSPVTARIGAELGGVDLADDLHPDTVAVIRQALVQWHVVFFRDQHLDGESQAAFARRLGPLTTGHPTIPSPEGEPVIFELDSFHGGRADHWHTDVTFVDRPPAISMLRAITLPDHGGDTMWASTEDGYNRLPEPLRHLADELRVVHTNAYDYGRALVAEEDSELKRHRDQFTSTVYETEHPMVRVHPESGRRSLVLGGFAKQIVGLPDTVSADLLRIFESYVLRPEHLVRWRWRPGDVAMWDNRATQHYAVNDYGDAYRRMQRVTVAGPLIVGLDGRTSVAIKGDSASYAELGAA